MSNFGEQVEAESILNTPRSPSTLSCITLGDVSFHQAAALSFLVEPDTDQSAELCQVGQRLASFHDVFRYQ